MKLTKEKLIDLVNETILEAAKRDYKAEYKKYGSSTKSKKYRAELNKYNRQKGTYGNGDKKDASHKGGKIVGFEEQSKNRGRAEKSRLKKEGKLTEGLKRFKVYVSGEKEPLVLMGKNIKDVKILAYQMIRNSSVRVRKVVKEGHDKEGKMAKFDSKEIFQDAQDIFKMIGEMDDLPEWLEAKITIAKENMNTVKDYLTHHHSGTNEGNLNEFGTSVNIDLGGNFEPHPKRKDRDSKNQGVFLQKFSNPEARKIIDGQLKQMAKDLRKVQARVIKAWMDGAKSGAIDFFDIIRGLKTGDARRAHPYETDFLVSVLTRDKIINRFRSYFKGKKGKKR